MVCNIIYFFNVISGKKEGSENWFLFLAAKHDYTLKQF